MNTEQSLRKKYAACERKVDRIEYKYIVKYGRNWTIATITPKEKLIYYIALHQLKKAIDDIIKFGLRSGKLQKK